LIDINAWDAVISTEGRWIAYIGDAGEAVYVVNRATLNSPVRMDVRTDGQPIPSSGSDYARDVAISADGRYVAFITGRILDSRVLPNAYSEEAYVHDRDADGNGIYDEVGQTKTTLMSIPNFCSDRQMPRLDLSDNGRYVIWYCSTPILPYLTDRDPDQNGVFDEPGEMAFITPTLSYSGTLAYADNATLSGDGRHMVFQGGIDVVPGYNNAGCPYDPINDANNACDIFVRPLLTGPNKFVSASKGGAQGNARSEAPAISPDGRYVAFLSQASNLVISDTNLYNWDVFVKDLWTSKIVRASMGADGSSGDANANQVGGVPALSEGGRYVAFVSNSPNLVPGKTDPVDDIFVFDRVISQTQQLTSGLDDDATSPSISGDGRYVVFTSNDQVFLADRSTGFASAGLLISDTTQAYTLTSYTLNTRVQFSPNTFQPSCFQIEMAQQTCTPPPSLSSWGNCFDLAAQKMQSCTAAGSLQAARLLSDVGLLKPYTLKVNYEQTPLESSLALYYWDDGAWVKEPSSSVDTTKNTITATSQQWRKWQVMSTTLNKIYLPLTLKNH
jgi:Tol biopolymer transport system component